jgi:hypothetical protein
VPGWDEGETLASLVPITHVSQEISEKLNSASHETFSLTGSEAQVEWAHRIRLQVIAEFDRVEAAFRSVALKQTPERRSDTEEIITILKNIRAAVLGHHQAGYFIHDWQEITDQVRQMIRLDPGYASLKTRPSH